MPRRSSTASNLPARWQARWPVPDLAIQRSLPREHAAGFVLDLWAERVTVPGERRELEEASRLIGDLALMTSPALCSGQVTLDSGSLRAAITLNGPGPYEPTWLLIAESSLEDLWFAVHLATRPEAADVRSAGHLLSMARLQRAIG